MIRTIISTDDSIATTILRLVLGVVFFAHGAQKMLGWFGGFGFAGTMGFFTGTMHIPAPLAFLAICAEFFGAMGLIIGFLTRIAVFGIATNMVVAMEWNSERRGVRISSAGAGDRGLPHDPRSRSLFRGPCAFHKSAVLWWGTERFEAGVNP